MTQAAVTEAPLTPAVRDRWSPRAFSDRPLAHADLLTLLEAARWAPSCKNEQPWRFVYGHRGTEAYQRLENLLDPWNLQWATQAPVLLLTAARRHYLGDGQPNAHAWHDVGLATGQLLVQATSMGIVAHPMAGFDWRGAPAALGFPDSYGAVCMHAIGYLGSPDQLSPELATLERRTRSRLPLSDVAFEGHWPDRDAP